MSLARIHIGLPITGIDLDSPARVDVPARPFAWSARDIDGMRYFTHRYLRPWPALGAYADTPDATRVTRLHNVLWGDGSSDMIRHVGAGVHRLSVGAWGSIKGALDVRAPVTNYWSSALVPGNSGRGFYLFSTDHRSAGPATDQIFFWDGAAASVSNTWASGTPNPARHVVSFADRAFLFNQLVAGTAQRRRAQWTIAGVGNSWTGTGSGNREFSEFEGAINGAGVLRGTLFVYAERSIVAGHESFDSTAPVYYTPVTTNGIGIWAPGSLVSYGDFHAFLSHEGFRAFDGSTITPIGAPIDAFILSNIERAAAEAVCSTVIPAPWNLAVWALPMGSTGLPTELWAYDFVRNRWTRTTSLYSGEAAVTAFAMQTRTTVVTWDALVGTWDAQTATWDALGGSASDVVIVSGHDDGETHTLDDTGVNPNVSITLDFPDWTFEGTVLFDRRSQGLRSASRVLAGDIATFDGIEITYSPLDAMTDSMLYLLVSTDGGSGYTLLDTITLTAGVANRTLRARSHARESGESLRLRLTNRNPSTGIVTAARFMFEDISLSVRRSGALREAAAI